MIINCFRCGKPLESPDSKNADYVMAGDMITEDICEVIFAIAEVEDPDPQDAKKIVVKVVETELAQATDAAGVPGRLQKVETRYLARPIQKTGVICPDCYRETDSLIWGVHKK